MMVALFVESMLVSFGLEVVGPVSRLDKALELAKHERLDLAILDVNINGKEIYPVADILAARNVPFIFATGYTGKRLSTQYRDRPTLQKPYPADELRAAIARIVPR